MYYDHQQIEKKWQEYWEKSKTFKTKGELTIPKYYILDMFPYPSGAGLHVGHPLGYIASDIVSRYKRHRGFNVLHPIGYDSFGLPAEQYAIQTGQHPAITTEENIRRYEEQMKRLGFSFDWDRQLRTSDADYYKFTQWIFIELFHSWYNKNNDKAESVDTLIGHLSRFGTKGLNATESEKLYLSADDWNEKNEEEKQLILLNYRLAFRAETTVNWCPDLGTVLANDEVINGRSERGGYPVEQKKMMQWNMRITAYSERLLAGLDFLDWSDAIKDTQRYWIGKSKGAKISFEIESLQEDNVLSKEKKDSIIIDVFTTRPDTIFGATFMVLAPENPVVSRVTTKNQKEEISKYITQTSLKSERERLADVKSVSGAFTGGYATNPFTGKKMPIYISDYVLMGYGTGAVMAVPAHDERDHRFAKKFGLDIIEVVAGGKDVQKESFMSKEGVCVNSDFLNGLKFEDAVEKIIYEIESRGLGHSTINYRQRDAIFSRQRYWGEPVPVYYKNNIPYTLPVSALPLELPDVEKYLPTGTGEPPLGNAKNWAWDIENNRISPIESINNTNIFPLELSTMPGWAGSSWYFLRYMDTKNGDNFVDKKLADYWGQVDLYIGGNEHATGHLLYSRFWNKFLKDRGYINEEEPFKKLINQGMILGMSAFVLRINDDETNKNKFISKNLANNYKTQKIHIDISLLEGSSDELNVEAFKKWRPEFANAEFILENGKYITEREVEKMSKSKYNVVNPDDICEQYGADCLRMYEMFLGPLEQSKPWNIQGLSGVYSFLKRFWKLYFNDKGEFYVVDNEPTKIEYKTLHTLLQKVVLDIENFSFNTSVSAFMIAVNEFTKLKTNKKRILEPLTIIISPYIPHISEEIWSLFGYKESIEYVNFPKFDSKYLETDEVEYPVSFNGKTRFKIRLSATLSTQEIEKLILTHCRIKDILSENIPKKIIIVPQKIINIVT